MAATRDKPGAQAPGRHPRLLPTPAPQGVDGRPSPAMTRKAPRRASQATCGLLYRLVHGRRLADLGAWKRGQQPPQPFADDRVVVDGRGLSHFLLDDGPLIQRFLSDTSMMQSSDSMILS